MSAYSEFFLSSSPAVTQLDCLEISHPKFSKVYRLVRNIYPGVVVNQTDSTSWIFDGIDDTVNFGNLLDFQNTDPFSLSIWVKASSNNNDAMFVKTLAGSTARGYQLAFRTTAPVGVMFQLCNDSNLNANCLKVYAANTIVDGSLHLVTATYDGSKTPGGVKIYFDGVSQSLTTFANTLTGTTLNTGALRISEFLTGQVRHASIWGIALTQAQVTEIYGSGAPGDLSLHSAFSNVKLWIHFDETDAVGAGGLHDASGNGFNGTAGGGLAPSTTGGADFAYTYCPMKVKPLGAQTDLDQSLEITLGDLGEILPAELDRVAAGNAFNVKPIVIYRTYRSDDLTAPLFGPVNLQVDGITFTHEGAAFNARATLFNITRTGEVYDLQRFPMLEPLS